MNALHQTRLVIGIALLATVLAGVASVQARGVDPAAPTEGAAAHVVWALSAVLAQLLAQCWVGMFGGGSLRLLRRRGHEVPRTLRWSVVLVPLGVVALAAVTVWMGIQGYTSGRRASVHGTLGWWTVGILTAAVLVEWRALEALDRWMAEADRSEVATSSS